MQRGDKQGKQQRQRIDPQLHMQAVVRSFLLPALMRCLAILAQEDCSGRADEGEREKMRQRRSIIRARPRPVVGREFWSSASPQ